MQVTTFHTNHLDLRVKVEEEWFCGRHEEEPVEGVGESCFRHETEEVEGQWEVGSYCWAQDPFAVVQSWLEAEDPADDTRIRAEEEDSIEINEGLSRPVQRVEVGMTWLVVRPKDETQPLKEDGQRCERGSDRRVPSEVADALLHRQEWLGKYLCGTEHAGLGEVVVQFVGTVFDMSCL